MYDIGENDRVLTEDLEKKKRKHQQRKQKRKQKGSLTQRIYNAYRNIKDLVNILRNKGSVDPNQMIFTGKMTDIAGLDGMKCSEVKNYMPNEEVYNATKENIMNARDSGHLNIDKDGTIHLTEKGRELTQSESFIKQFEQDQKEALQSMFEQQGQQPAYCELDGTAHDMGAFNYTDSIDMNAIEDSPQKEAVLNNFQKMESDGLVNINDGVITPTENGMEFAKVQSFSVKPANTEELNNIFSSVGKLNAADAQPSIQAVQDNGNMQLPAGLKTAAAAGNASQTASKASASAATQTGANAAATAAASTATSAAATGARTATTGAATLGVGAVITVATETLKQVATQSMRLVQSAMDK